LDPLIQSCPHLQCIYHMWSPLFPLINACFMLIHGNHIYICIYIYGNFISHHCFGGCLVLIWLVVWNSFYFTIYWECHHPNWRTLWFFKGVAKNHQPVILWGGGVHNEILKRNSTNCGIIYRYSPFEIGEVGKRLLTAGGDMFIISINSAWTGMYITWCRSGSISHQTWWIMSTRCMMNIYMGWYTWPKSQTRITLLWWDRFWVNPEL
jgi:hypothetical protein